MTPPNDHGSYLIRNSISTLGGYSLSVRDRNDVKHYKINRSDNGGFYIVVPWHNRFNTLQDLVAHCKQEVNGLPVNLINPCCKPNEWEIDRSALRFVKNIMVSEICEVWQGVWNQVTPVTIKAYKPVMITKKNFLQTIALMKKLYHPNIIQLYAVCTKEKSMCIITEFMKHGSLFDYVRGKGRSTKLPQLIDMASQVAAGMAYLEEQNVIHRDLAARNILAGENLVCKVANFEMAQVVNEGGINMAPHIEKFAMKWTAPEAILHYEFSSKSDVWSFGIVLYEIITYGRFPYPAMTNSEVKEQIVQGYRMPQPKGCPDQLYNIMLHCWRENPTSRPRFEALQWQLEEIKDSGRFR